MKKRRFLSAMGGLAVVGSGLLGSRTLIANAAELAMPSPECHPTIRQGEGPYLTPDSQLRSDIREDRSGVPVHLTLHVKDDFWCTPIEGAAVDIWHCDTMGQYSGIVNELIDQNSLLLSGETNDMTGSSFLRGHQVSDKDGKVEFTTIFPGWYTGRLTHFHVKTIIAGLRRTSHNTQLYLPTELENAVYSSAPYADRGQNPMNVTRDLVVRGDTKAVDQLTIPMTKDGEGFRGEFELAVTF